MRMLRACKGQRICYRGFLQCSGTAECLSHVHDTALPSGQSYANAAASPFASTAPIVFLMQNKRVVHFPLSRLSACVCAVYVYALNTSAYANIITVTNTHDSGPGSLRQALVDAQTATPSSSIPC